MTMVIDGSNGITFPNSTTQATAFKASYTSLSNVAIGDTFVGCVNQIVPTGGTYTATNTKSVEKYFFRVPGNNQSPNSVHGFAYSNGIYLAGGNYNSVYRSTDGFNWATINPQPAVNPNTTTISYNDFVFFNGFFYTCCDYGAGSILSSPDASTWTLSNATGKSMYAFAVGPDKLVCVGAGGDLYYTLDGVNWTKSASGGTNTFYGVAYGVVNGSPLYIASGSYSGSAAATIWTSTDGITWTSNAGPTGAAKFYNNTVAIGSNVGIIITEDSNNSLSYLIEVTTPTTFTFKKYLQVPNTSAPVAAAALGDTVYSQNCFFDSVNNLFYVVSGYGSNYAFNGALTQANLVFSPPYYQAQTPFSVRRLNGTLYMGGDFGFIFFSPPTNLITSANDGSAAPAGTYKCLGSVFDSYPQYLWQRVS